MAGPILGTMNTAVKKKKPCSHGVYILKQQTYKEIKKENIYQMVISAVAKNQARQ